ncbi:T9SS type A sorting domain-containing protein [Dyadobacter sandarakinus]|uniref:T9SS type A sorting domain-containing protein n=1 Tax=Dyadobacter sandarakinus TaxID=2747268 RepID=A0ABX7IC25_9BACT|nr:T9SS type A sorting domain-containing protein [Dyadobacter sandarakinus]QRR03268.1 T9SS type A sorting domain-containing protein [Dyadobacter sandarakinus]
MKTTTLRIALGILLCASAAQAQFTSGDQFYMPATATVSIQGLIFQPALNTTWSDVDITPSGTAIPGQPTSSIKRVYKFDTPMQFSGTVGIRYDPSELNGNTETDLKIAYYNAQDGYVTTVQGNVDAANHIVNHAFALQNIEKITAGNSNATFPVSLIAFAAKKSERTAVLSWNTATEVNSEHFEVQHSTDGKAWQLLGKVIASGQSQTVQNYTYADINPAAGENLYRLKMVDLDGTFSYSQIARLRFDYEISSNVYPNPVADVLLVKAENWSNVKSLEVINSMGRKVYDLGHAKATQTEERAFDFSALPQGIYIIKTTKTNGEVQAEKVLKR